MKTIHGDVPVPLNAREDLAVKGTLSDAVIVHGGTSLFVHGALRGSITIEAGARVVLAGTLGAFIDRNDGSLAVAGEIATPLETIPGTVTIAAGTVVTVNAATWVLTADGSLQPLTGVTDISLSSTDVLAWDAATASFPDHTSEDFRDLARTFWGATL
jgi:hypothetical protein